MKTITNEFEMETLTSVIQTLRKRGYTKDFSINPSKNELRKRPDEFVIDKTYRFEGITDPDDEAILYAISSSKIKGILINGYGISSDETINMLVQGVKQREWRASRKSWGLGINISKSKKEKSDVFYSSKCSSERFNFCIE